jgi:hypothetical protein
LGWSVGSAEITFYLGATIAANFRGLREPTSISSLIVWAYAHVTQKATLLATSISVAFSFHTQFSWNLKNFPRHYCIDSLYSLAMKICTKAKAAKLLKVSRATIYALIERGELVPNDLGYVDLDQLPRDKDFSKRGRKCKEKNAGECTNTVVHTPEQLKDRYIAKLEAENAHLRERVVHLMNEVANDRELQLAVRKMLDLYDPLMEAMNSTTKATPAAHPRKSRMKERPHSHPQAAVLPDP